MPYICKYFYKKKKKLHMKTNNLKSLDGGTINSAINENVNDSTRVMNQVDNNIKKTPAYAPPLNH